MNVTFVEDPEILPSNLYSCIFMYIISYPTWTLRTPPTSHIRLGYLRLMFKIPRERHRYPNRLHSRIQPGDPAPHPSCAGSRSTTLDTSSSSLGMHIEMSDAAIIIFRSLSIPFLARMRPWIFFCTALIPCMMF